MPLCYDTRCDQCGDKKFFTSEGLTLQLDDASLVPLAHPGESWECEKHGLTLFQASQRKRLFRQNYFICRHCGVETYSIERAYPTMQIGEVGDWTSVKLCIVAAVIGVPIALWMQSWTWVTILLVLAILSPLIDLNERRKLRLDRERKGLPLLPTANAPGLVPVPEPQNPVPCCAAPDFIPIAELRNGHRVPCNECKKGVLVVTMTGIS